MYDVAIIGTGLVGSTLATILSKNRLKVICFEAGQHPKFSIGESLIIETSEMFRALAELYDVPELHAFGSENQFAFVGHSHGVKRHFSYLYHREGHEIQDTREVLQAVIPREPYGHEMHLYRQDADSLLTSLSIRHGAEVRQRNPVQDIEIGGDGVEIVTKAGDRVKAKYVVDAGGFRSILAEKYQLRDFNLRTNTRTIFTHFIDVPSYHQVCGVSPSSYGIPFSLAEGTLHHIFKGGWMWVIPFNNHPTATNPLCSVGLVLNRDMYPRDESVSGEEEFWAFMKRFPSIGQHFEGARPVRNWVTTDRINYSSKKVVGDRWTLLGHAAGFIDPLFSKGLYTSLACVDMVAKHLLEAQQDGDYSAEKFAPIEKKTLAYVKSADTVVSCSIMSFGDYRVWQRYSSVWLLGAYTEGMKLALTRTNASKAREGYRAYFHRQTANMTMSGGAYPGFWELDKRICDIIDSINFEDEDDILRACVEMDKIMEETSWVPDAIKAITRGKKYLPKNKARLALLKKNGGFMGPPDYHRHIFDGLGYVGLVWFILKEKLKYSPRRQEKLWRKERVEAL